MTLTDGNVSISENLGYKDLGEIMVTTHGTNWKPLKKTTIANMWTKDDTEVTTTSMTADKGSIFIDQFTFKLPELIQVAITIFSS